MCIVVSIESPFAQTAMKLPNSVSCPTDRALPERPLDMRKRQRNQPQRSPLRAAHDLARKPQRQDEPCSDAQRLQAGRG